MANYRFFALNFGEWCIVWLPQEPGFRVVTRQISNTALWMQQPLEPFTSSSISGSGFGSASASSSGYTSQSAGLASQNSTVVPRGAFRVVWSW